MNPVERPSAYEPPCVPGKTGNAGSQGGGSFPHRNQKVGEEGVWSIAMCE